jgi:hypothetical protein
MKGWEATAQAGEIDFPTNYAIYSSALLDQAVEMGLNRVRLELHGDTENPTPRPTHVAINDNSDPNTYNAAGFNWGEFDTNVIKEVIPLRTRLAAQGESLYVNLCYVDFLNAGGSFYHSDNAAEYAELVLAAFNRMNSQWGFVPDSLEIILEPDAGTNAGRWTATKVANCLIATQARLAAAGYHPRFIVPAVTDCNVAAAWYNNIKAANSNVTQYIDELSYHRYGNCTPTSLAQNRDAAQADGNHISMLEWWDPSNSYTTLHQDIGPNGNAVSWQGSVIAYPNQPDSGGVYFLVNSSTNAVTMASRTKFYRQYFKWVRLGAVRKGTTTANANFDGLAFRNTGGNYTVVVNCLTGGSFTVGGLPAGRYHITYTTASAYNQNAADQTITAGQNISTNIPAAGALTIHADSP